MRGYTPQIVRVELVETKDDGEQQTTKLLGLAGEELDRVLRVQPHGFTSHAPKGSEGVLFAPGGARDRSVVLGFEHPEKRIKDLPEGATAIYDAAGNVIRLVGTDGIKVKATDAGFVVEAKGVTVEATGDHVSVKPGDGKNVYLGGKPGTGTFALVSTVSGPSTNVFARIA